MTPYPPRPLLHTLPLQIADQLTAAIIEERYAPGMRLKETELASAYDVSRGPLREALRILETRGLVRILPQRGAQVTIMSAADLMDLFEVRAFLVGLIARRVAETPSASVAAAMDRLQADLEAASYDGQSYAQVSARTAVELANLSENTHLIAILSSFSHRIARYARLGLLSASRRKQSIRLWRKLFQAIKDGDAVLAEQTNRQLSLENRDAAVRELQARGSHGI